MIPFSLQNLGAATKSQLIKAVKWSNKAQKPILLIYPG